jgi:hypothetical protein
MAQAGDMMGGSGVPGAIDPMLLAAIAKMARHKSRRKKSKSKARRK